MKYLQRRRKERLFQQWVEQAELPPEGIPPDLLSRPMAKETGLAADDITRDKVPGHTTLIDIDRGMVRLPLRYVLLGLAIMALLLVILSVIITVLIVRS